jgi:hypothetical protein
MGGELNLRVGEGEEDGRSARSARPEETALVSLQQAVTP